MPSGLVFTVGLGDVDAPDRLRAIRARRELRDHRIDPAFVEIGGLTVDAGVSAHGSVGCGPKASTHKEQDSSSRNTPFTRGTGLHQQTSAQFDAGSKLPHFPARLRFRSGQFELIRPTVPHRGKGLSRQLRRVFGNISGSAAIQVDNSTSYRRSRSYAPPKRSRKQRLAGQVDGTDLAASRVRAGRVDPTRRCEVFSRFPRRQGLGREIGLHAVFSPGTSKLGGQMPLPTSITSSDALPLAPQRRTPSPSLGAARGHGRFRRRRMLRMGSARLSPGRMILPVHNSRSPSPFLRRPVLRQDAGGAAHARAPAAGGARDR
ncbi:unnamed protein product [Acanthosepion pharaonis]|uniref:Uncharacterized protein n=1 Tax=Acanthosepion pharaonis TaxID=158019 RepID=A0A812DTE7_ACAPH|nr:unnamed protein product [Sepia pharaonis]